MGGDSAEDSRGILVPRQRSIPFAEIRSMSSEEFVKLLVDGMGVHGVVAGTNYRFGVPLPAIFIGIHTGRETGAK